MAEITCKDIKVLRISQGLSQADLADRVGVDASTIAHYERGDYELSIDLMFEVCEALGNTRLWQEWMCQRYPVSYGTMHPVVRDDVNTVPGAVLNLLNELGDVFDLRDRMIRDAVDGKLDDPTGKPAKEIRELIDAGENFLRLLRKMEAHDGKVLRR